MTYDKINELKLEKVIEFMVEFFNADPKSLQDYEWREHLYMIDENVNKKFHEGKKRWGMYYNLPMACISVRERTEGADIRQCKEVARIWDTEIEILDADNKWIDIRNLKNSDRLRKYWRGIE